MNDTQRKGKVLKYFIKVVQNLSIQHNGSLF